MRKSIVLLLLWACALPALAENAGNWMNRLPDDTYVAVVSIPGAHDAATGSGFEEGSEELGMSFAQTQELTIGEMWSLGIRAFDLRPCVYKDYMNINHGIVPTALRFEKTLYELRDSLRANPSEFVVIHLLHETDGDIVSGVYNERLIALLQSDMLKDCLVDFKPGLKVSEARGKMLILSRDKYATRPVTGGIFENWTGALDWSRQTQAKIIGPSTTGILCVQDFSDTHAAGALDKKTQAIEQMLRFSMTRKTTTSSSVRWVFNFASAYSLVQNIFGYEVSLSDGYRDNAVHTHACIINYLATHNGGPTGVILMDYVGVDKTGDFEVRGKEVVKAIIDNNFRYLEDRTSGVQSTFARPASAGPATYYSLRGECLPAPARAGEVTVVRQSDGHTRKVMLR